MPDPKKKKKAYKKNLNLIKDFKSGFMAIKDQTGVQAFLFQFKIYSQGNK